MNNMLHVHVCSTKGRASSKNKEDEEDAELLRDEEEEMQHAHRLPVQPSIITGGVLREYQMQGLNWMIHLYDNGINGILADEMVRVVAAGGEAVRTLVYVWIHTVMCFCSLQWLVWAFCKAVQHMELFEPPKS